MSSSANLPMHWGQKTFRKALSKSPSSSTTGLMNFSWGDQAKLGFNSSHLYKVDVRLGFYCCFKTFSKPYVMTFGIPYATNCSSFILCLSFCTTHVKELEVNHKTHLDECSNFVKCPWNSDAPSFSFKIIFSSLTACQMGHSSIGNVQNTIEKMNWKKWQWSTAQFSQKPKLNAEILCWWLNVLPLLQSSRVWARQMLD